MTKDIKDKSQKSGTEKSIAEKLEEVDTSKISKAADVCKLIPLMFEVLKEMNNKLDDVINVKAANEKLATKVSLLEKRINELEFDKYRNSVRINNLAVTAKKDNDETKAESMSVMDSLLEDLEIAQECEITDAFRIPSKNSKYLLTMIVTFKDQKDHSTFFKNLKFAKTAGHDIFVSQQYPPSLTENLKELERQAKEIRKKDFNTQIRFSKGQLGLFHRKKGSKDEWEKVDKS